MNKAISKYEYRYCGDLYTLERVPGGWIISRDRGPHLGTSYLCSARRAAVWWDRIPAFKWTRDRRTARVYQWRTARHHFYFMTGESLPL